LSDGVSLGIVSNSPYALVASNIAAGAHLLRAVAMDNRGATNTSAPVSVSVVNAAPIILSDAVRLSPSQFRFTYSANTGLSYVVERGPAPAGMSALITNVSSGSNVVFTDLTATNSLNFYRVGRLPNP
jgi:hypothetical protein